MRAVPVIIIIKSVFISGNLFAMQEILGAIQRIGLAFSALPAFFINRD